MYWVSTCTYVQTHLFVLIHIFIYLLPRHVYICIHILSRHVHIYTYCLGVCTYEHIYCRANRASSKAMGWLRLVGSLKLYVSVAKEPYTRDYILQKRPTVLRSLLIVATPY